MRPSPPPVERRPAPPERSRRRWRLGLPVLGLLLMPKCVLCVLAYAAGGALVGASGRELCGAPGANPLASLAPWLGGGAVAAVFLLWRRCAGTGR